MIGRLSGVLAALDDNLALVDVNGVGYDVVIPARLRNRVSVGDPIVLHTHLSVVNDVQQLYGFESIVDRMVFRKLLGVNRLGPKSAAALCSELSGHEIARAIDARDHRTLTVAQGIGAKAAESIVFALREDVSKWGLSSDGTDSKSDAGSLSNASAASQAIAALRQLGFQRHEAEDAIAQAFEDGLGVGDLIQRALRLIGTKV
ncbi:MAG: Holliday junction ATP-dependent DNA helicase RuvA [Gammaproteobacteria bacterium]|nr:Holliday junction ATP-dependent DNA helicase RuvA [Gammaproteobacteria bacterium]